MAGSLAVGVSVAPDGDGDGDGEEAFAVVGDGDVDDVGGRTFLNREKLYLYMLLVGKMTLSCIVQSYFLIYDINS
jgi:hypothetical protein